eukprot:TRINITY_DN2882_c0_g1_i2.p1 TRINITY_DN2882_c0_g1~~TRINITY_DN2882_c0_g1_i2.p1  ORF type:complete len:218 (+),score=63.38 TRINITY_DN2882_c0_g1_i2:27-680(+)
MQGSSVTNSIAGSTQPCKMAKAGDQYEHATGNIWNYANRGDTNELQRILSRGIDVNLKNKVGWTALHAACYGGRLKAVHFLLKNNANLEARDKAGRTPFLEAMRCGHFKVAQALAQDYKADVYVRDNQGKTAALMAKGPQCRGLIETMMAAATPSSSKNENGSKQKGKARGRRAKHDNNDSYDELSDAEVEAIRRAKADKKAAREAELKRLHEAGSL